jgi:DHA1 family solute carrier family 18 vesicular amine transporter 1/2
MMLARVICLQIYDHVKHGWTVICLLAMSLNLACLILAFVYTGGDPLWARFARLLRRRTKLDPVPDSNTIHC